MKVSTIIAAIAIVLGGTAIAPAQPGAMAAIELSDGTRLPPNPSLPKLELTNAQREQIRQAVLTEHNAVQFRLKATRPAKDFVPAVGVKLPGGVKAQGLPAPVLAQIPQVRDYWYVKMKDQVLIVDGMTSKIVDMFSETQPVT
jgi:hypothetical protein